jgi:hypothetical protein
MPDRGEENDHIMHGPGNDRAEDDPQRPGQIPELGGQDRPQERPRRRNGREMVPEQDKFIGLHIIVPIGQFNGRRQPLNL